MVFQNLIFLCLVFSRSKLLAHFDVFKFGCCEGLLFGFGQDLGGDWFLTVTTVTKPKAEDLRFTFVTSVRHDSKLIGKSFEFMIPTKSPGAIDCLSVYWLG